MSDHNFESASHFDAHHPNALAIYCSDGRYTEAVENLLRHLGHERLDTLTMPGGPGLLNLRSAAFADTDAITRGASFLIRGHSIEKVVLLAHSGCGYYRARFVAQTPESIYARQIVDLRAAGQSMKAIHPGIEVSMYYARTAGNRVRFEHLAD